MRSCLLAKQLKKLLLVILLLLPLLHFGQEGVKPGSHDINKPVVLPEDRVKQKVADFYNKKNKRKLFFIPFVSWNNYDKFQLGAGLFTHPIKNNRFEFRTFPSWSFGAHRINFSGHASLHLRLSKPDSYIQPFLWGQSYSYNHLMNRKDSYYSIHGGIKAAFHENKKLKTGTHVQLTWHSISKNVPVWNATDSLYEIKSKQYHYADFSLNSSIFRQPTENNLEFRTELNQKFCKTSISFLFREEFSDKGYIELRFFAGTFLYRKLLMEEDHRFRLSGITGRYDYSFSLPYLSRSESSLQFTTAQMYPGDGYFKTAVPLGQSWDWLTSVNFRTRIPGKIPLQLYFDIGTYKNAGTLYQGNSKFPWNAGITFQIWKDYAEIFIPLLMSNDIKEIYSLYQVNFFNRISWMIRFDELNPFKLLKQ